MITSPEQSIQMKLYNSHVVQVSTLGIKVIFLQSDGEHGLGAWPASWDQGVLVGAVDQIIAGVLVVAGVLVTLLIWVLAVVVHH